MIITKGLGWREMQALLEFCIYLQNYCEGLTGDDFEKFDVGYDVHYDEPYVSMGFSTLYRTDFEPEI